jgi:hypothetical protein
MSIDAQEHQADTLAMRMLVFYALKKDHPDLPGKLKLIRKSVETGVTDPFDGDQLFFWELHAGFIFGGRRLESNSGGGYDCSDFMASLLAERGSGTESLSTGFLKDIARRLAKEKGSRKLSKEEGALASCFAAVDLRAGESPQPGDFVISKNDTLEDGHVAIVKEVTEDGSIRTIEAAGAANAIVSKTRPLYEPMPACPEQEDQLPVRPDLFVLRLKGKPPRTCPLS